jgi:Ca2+/H+ antiporter
MQALARMLQLAGLTIPPLAIIAQLGQHITAGQMLQFLVVSVCLFLTGYLLQQFRGAGK